MTLNRMQVNFWPGLITQSQVPSHNSTFWHALTQPQSRKKSFMLFLWWWQLRLFVCLPFLLLLLTQHAFMHTSLLPHTHPDTHTHEHLLVHAPFMASLCANVACHSKVLQLYSRIRIGLRLPHNHDLIQFSLFWQRTQQMKVSNCWL